MTHYCRTARLSNERRKVLLFMRHDCSRSLAGPRSVGKQGKTSVPKKKPEESVDTAAVSEKCTPVPPSAAGSETRPPTSNERCNMNSAFFFRT